MQAYSTVRQIGRREHGHAGRVHRRPQQEVGDGCGLAPAFVMTDPFGPKDSPMDLIGPVPENDIGS